MSDTPISFPAIFPLQLDFVQAGAMHKDLHGWVHQKTIPYMIVAQAQEGTYEVCCQNRHEVLPAGEVFVVPANTPVEITHWNGRKGVMKCRWMHLRFTYLGSFDFLSFYKTPLRMPPRESRQLGSLISALQKCALKNGPAPQDFLTSHDIAFQALRLICQVSVAESPQAQARILGQRLNPVLVHIRENLGRQFTVASLAKVAGFSSSQFQAIFKKELKMSPMHYVRVVRLESASRRLVATRETISQIAKATGFVDPFHFSHAFAAHFGISPREYRQRASRGTA